MSCCFCCLPSRIDACVISNRVNCVDNKNPVYILEFRYFRSHLESLRVLSTFHCQLSISCSQEMSTRTRLADERLHFHTEIHKEKHAYIDMELNDIVIHKYCIKYMYIYTYVRYIFYIYFYSSYISSHLLVPSKPDSIF